MTEALKHMCIRQRPYSANRAFDPEIYDWCWAMGRKAAEEYEGAQPLVGFPSNFATMCWMDGYDNHRPKP